MTDRERLDQMIENATWRAGIEDALRAEALEPLRKRIAQVAADLAADARLEEGERNKA